LAIGVHGMSTPVTDHPRLLVSLCTYNERENLPGMIREILASVPFAHVVVVDDNSPDGTGQLADEIAAGDSRVKVLHRPGKQGLGTAILAGFRFAIDHDYELLINMDADFSHHPRHLPALLDCMNRVDVAIGSRYVAGGGVIGWNWWRHFMSRGINWYARRLLRLRTRDNSGSYRCYRIAKLRELDLTRFRAKGYAFQEEILYRCRRIGCRFEETPIVFEDRRFGTSKINKREVLSALWVILILAIENVRGVAVTATPDTKL
jgi:dolichol-phosphate mannosyltransferase